MKPEDTYKPIDPEPSLSDRRIAAINQMVAPDYTPPAQHPMAEFARNLLSPLNPIYGDAGAVGPTGPQQPAYPDYGYRTRDPAEQQDFIDRTLRRGAYAPPPNLGPAGSLGPRGPMGPEQQPDLGSRLAPAGGMSMGNPVDFGGFLGGVGRGLENVQSLGSRGFQAVQEAPGNVLGNLPVVGQGLQNIGRGIDTRNERDLVDAAKLLYHTDNPTDKQLEALSQYESMALGSAAGLTENVGGGDTLGPLGKRIIARSGEQAASGSAGAAAANEAVAAARGPVEPGTGGALKAGTLADRQIEALRRGGASDEDIAAFQKTMAPAGEVGTGTRRGTVMSAEGQKVDARNLTRSLQTAAGSEGVALSQHPAFEQYGAKGARGPKVARAHGGDIGTATRAVMAGDSEAIQLLGDKLTNELIQNKVAHVIRETGAPEDVIRRGLGILARREGAAAADAVPTEVVKAGSPPPPNPIADANVADIRGALGATPTPDAPPIDFGPEPQLGGGGGEQPPQGPKLVGTSPNESPIPFGGPPKATAQSLATEAFHVLTDIPRSLMVIGHLPILRQGLPLMADAVARGNPKEIPLALGRSISAVTDLTGMRSAAITQGFRDTLSEAGLKVGRDGVHISDPVGPVAAREEFGLHSFLAKVPVIANLNRAYPTMLNSLRTGAAVDLARLYRESGRPVESAKIGHFVNIASGRGDIPAILDTPAARDALSGIFFGPRLTTASWQMATDTVGALRGVGGDLISRKRLDPVQVAQVRTTAAYVATGVGIMKLANAFGMNIGVDPTKTDFGRITLPDGKRVDLWGPFNENARLIAREVESIAGNLQGKPDYGARTGIDVLLSYVRSKLNAGAPTAVGDLLAGSTQGGQSIPEAYGTPQGLQEHLLPLPFAAQEATSGSSGGFGMEAAETALTAAGASVIDTPATVHYDGVGTPDSSGEFGKDPVLQEFQRMQAQDPNWKKQSTLQPPDTTIGSGRNSIKLDSTSAAVYVQLVGEARRRDVSAVIYSSDYQNASLAQQEKMYDAAVSKADNEADRQFLAHGVIDSTDPKTIQAEAVAGFHAQGTNRERAYWVALLDRAGKLTPEVRAAIDESQITRPGEKAPITADEYVKAAPLVHEYLAHVPYGTDAKPIGTPADWTAVAQAKVAQSNRKDELVRGGINPSVADLQAQRETLAKITSLVQRSLFLQGALLENPQRKLLASKYPTLSRFIGSNANTTRESDQEFRNYPFGQ